MDIKRVLQRSLSRLAFIVHFLRRSMTLGVRAACFDSQGRLFLVRHTYMSGWYLPGGGVERGETMLEALEKEMREEGNLELGDPPQLFSLYLNERASRRDHVALYICRNVRQTGERKPDYEIAECGFFELDSLPDGVTKATRARLAEIAGAAPVSQKW